MCVCVYVRGQFYAKKAHRVSVPANLVKAAAMGDMPDGDTSEGRNSSRPASTETRSGAVSPAVSISSRRSLGRVAPMDTPMHGIAVAGVDVNPQGTSAAGSQPVKMVDSPVKSPLTPRQQQQQPVSPAARRPSVMQGQAGVAPAVGGPAAHTSPTAHAASAPPSGPTDATSVVTGAADGGGGSLRRFSSLLPSWMRSSGSLTSMVYPEATPSGSSRRASVAGVGVELGNDVTGVTDATSATDAAAAEVNPEAPHGRRDSINPVHPWASLAGLGAGLGISDANLLRPRTSESAGSGGGRTTPSVIAEGAEETGLTVDIDNVDELEATVNELLSSPSRESVRMPDQRTGRSLTGVAAPATHQGAVTMSPLGRVAQHRSPPRRSPSQRSPARRATAYVATTTAPQPQRHLSPSPTRRPTAGAVRASVLTVNPTQRSPTRAVTLASPASATSPTSPTSGSPARRRQLSPVRSGQPSPYGAPASPVRYSRTRPAPKSPDRRL